MPDPDTPADRIRRAQRGDRTAAGELWLGQRRFVATILIAHRGNRDLDDLLQEVALRMTRSIGDLEDPTQLRPWLRAIARNVAIDHGRRATAAPHLQIVAASDDDDRRDRGATEPWFDAPARQRQRDELEATLRDLDDLDSIYREPLLLRAVDGLSQREIAEVLGIPETTVETRLARARRFLRERVDATTTTTTTTTTTDTENQTGVTTHAPRRRTVD